MCLAASFLVSVSVASRAKDGQNLLKSFLVNLSMLLAVRR